MRITGRQLGKYCRFPFSYTCQFGFFKLFSLTYPTDQIRCYAPNTESRCCPCLYTFKQETVFKYLGKKTFIIGGIIDCQDQKKGQKFFNPDISQIQSLNLKHPSSREMECLSQLGRQWENCVQSSVLSLGPGFQPSDELKKEAVADEEKGGRDRRDSRRKQDERTRVRPRHHLLPSLLGKLAVYCCAEAFPAASPAPPNSHPFWNKCLPYGLD